MSALGQCQCWTVTWYFFSDTWELLSVFLAILDLLIVNTELVAEYLNWSEQYREAGTWVNQRCVVFESEVSLLLVCKDVKLCDQVVHLSNSWESAGCDSLGGFWVFLVKVPDFPHSLQLLLSSQSKHLYLLDQSASSHSRQVNDVLGLAAPLCLCAITNEWPRHDVTMLIHNNGHLSSL